MAARDNAFPTDHPRRTMPPVVPSSEMGRKILLGEEIDEGGEFVSTGFDFDVSLLIVSSIHDDVNFDAAEWSGCGEGVDGDETGALGDRFRLHFFKDNLRRISFNLIT